MGVPIVSKSDAGQVEGVNKNTAEDPFGYDPQGWRKTYYSDYSTKMAQVGGTPVDPATFFSKYGIGSKVEGKIFGQAAESYDKDIVQTGKDNYNNLAKEYSTLVGQKPENYQGADSIQSVSDKLKQLQSNFDYYKNDPDALNEINPEKYEFKMEDYPDLIDVREMADKWLAEEQPTFSTDLVSEWQKTMDPLYQTRKAETTTQARDLWGSLFQQGGGSTYEAGKLQKVLSDIDNEKLEKAIAFAEADYNNKNAAWLGKQAQAVNTKSALGELQASSDKFGSELDWRNMWTGKSNDIAKENFYDTMAFQNAADEKNFKRALQIAESYGDGSDEYTEALNSLIKGAAGAGTAAIIASSRDFKNSIKPNETDSVGLIKNLEIVNFKYNGDNKERVGVIAEDSPDAITTPDKKGLDIVNMFGVILDAIQKLTLRIETIEARRQ